MAQKPQGFKNHIEKVAIVGAGGRIGRPITEALLQTGKFTITVLTRADSTNTAAIPSGASIQTIDYDDQKSLVTALTGKDCLIITMSVRAPPDQQTRLIDAAAEAKVGWVLPNEYGFDQEHPGLHKEIPIIESHTKYLAQIEELGVSSWLGITCGFWYEYSLSAGPFCYGFDLPNRAVTFFDDGKTRINTSTLPQCARGVANLLSLKILPDDEDDDARAYLSHYRNRFVYISSFKVSQRDMLDSLLRVTDTEESDWKINHESSVERHKAGWEELRKGSQAGFAKLMYGRVFYQDGIGDFEASKGLQNEVLRLPKEDLDEYTKIATQIPPIQL